MVAPGNLGGHRVGQNTFLRGQKFKNLPKITDFAIFPFDWVPSGDRTSDWGKSPNYPLVLPLAMTKNDTKLPLDFQGAG